MRNIFERDLGGEMVSPADECYGSIVGVQSVVTRDVPPMTIVAGNPARIIRKIDK